jgi:hypothetical protein
MPVERMPVSTPGTAVSLLLPILGLALLASLSPATIIVFILVLATTRAHVNALAFLVGWGASLTIVFAVAYAIGGTHTAQHGSGRIGVEVVEIGLGVVLFVAGGQRWQRRNTPRPSSGTSKALANRLTQLHPSEAAILGVIKEPWSLTAAAAVLVAHYHSGVFLALLAFVVFTVVSTATVGLTFWYHSQHPRDAEARLSTVKDRLVRASPAIFATVSVAVGLYLTIDGIIGLLNS